MIKVNKTTITAIKLLILRSFQRKGFCCNDGSLEAAQARTMTRAAKNNFQDPDAYEKMQFYYHPDHLGSSSYITNLDGEVVQH